MNTTQLQHPTPSMEEQLLEAAREGNTEKLEYVLSYGTVNLSVTDPDNGATALHLACKNIQPQIVKLLLENGLNINAVDSIQNTPLHLAALMGHKEIVTLLLDNGADLTIKNTKNETAETLASTDEIRQLIKARPGLRGYQQEQLERKTISSDQAVNPQMKEGKLVEHLQQQEVLNTERIQHIPASRISAACISFSGYSDAPFIPSPRQENNVKQIDESNVEIRLTEIQGLYKSKNYLEASNLIRTLLKFCNKSTNEKKYKEIEYQCFTTLGNIYLIKDSENKDLQDYPKAAALYQYARRMIAIDEEKLLAEGKPLADVDRKLAEIEEIFVKSIASSGLHYECDLSLATNCKKTLEDFRSSLKPRLDAIKNLGIENDELNEKKLYKRAKIVGTIYNDIKSFFIGQEDNNKGLLVKLIERTKTILGPVPHEAEYAIIGFGSMALGTMTPWSDIEFAILIQEELDNIQKKEVKDYFYKLTTLLHIYIINFGETELAAMAIKELNDFTSDQHDDWFWDKLMSKGLSFDAQRPIGCKTPLGRKGLSGHKDYELICTPTDLAKYQDEWAEIEPTLPQLLLTTTFIDGNRKLLEQDAIHSKVNVNNGLLNAYNQLIQSKLDQKEMNGLSRIQQRSLEILKKDQTQYSPWKSMEDTEGRLFNVKKEIYRYPDRIFVAISSYLGKYSLDQWSSLRKLSENDTCKVDENTVKNLVIAFSIACELRLNTYCNNVGQNEQFSAFQTNYIDSNLENVEAKLVNYFKLPNINILKAFFYITGKLSVRVVDYLHLLQSNDNFVGQKTLILTEISLTNVIDYLKGHVSIRLMDYKNAIAHLERAKSRPEEVFYNEPEMCNIGLISILHELSEAYSYSDISQAIKYAEEAKDLCEKEGSNKIILMSLLHKLGCLYRQHAEYEQAFKYFEQAGILLEEEFGKQHISKVALLTNLATIRNDQCSYKEAIIYLEQSKAICEQLGNQRHPYMAFTLENLGVSHTHLLNYNQAIQYYEQAIIIHKENFGTEHPCIANIANCLGVVYLKQENYKEATKYFEEAKAIYESKFDIVDIRLAMILDNLGAAIYGAFSDFVKAIKYFKQAIAIHKKMSETEHPAIANTLNNIGVVYSDIFEYRKAIKYHEKAKAIYERIFGTAHPTIANTLHKLGINHSKLGDSTKAIEYYEQANAIWVETLGAEHHEIADTLLGLGNIYKELSDYRTAINCYEKARIIYEKKFGAEHFNTASTLVNLGAAYEQIGNDSQAMSYYHQAKAIYQEKYGLEHPHIAVIFNNLAWIYRNLSQYEQAIEYYAQALTIQEKLFPDHPDTAFMLHRLSEVYDASGNYAQQIVCLEKALAIRERCFGNTHLDVAFTLYGIGKAYQSLNQNQKKIEYHGRAFEILEAVSKNYQNSNVALGDLVNAYLSFVNQSIEEGNISLAVFYQKKINSLIQNRIIKHNLSCYYHIFAQQALQDNNYDGYVTNLSKAKTNFLEALNLETVEPVSASLYTEYAMFLFMSHDKNNNIEYKEIVDYLIKVESIKNDGSGLGYGQLEKLTVIESLQKLLEHEPSISVRPDNLASYLMIKAHLLHQNRPEAESAFEVFKQSIEENEAQATSVSFWLLYNAAEELGYSDQARVLKEKYEAMTVTETK